MKLTRSNPFRLHLIEKNNLWGLMEEYLSRSDCQLTIYSCLKPIFSMFQKAIKFDCLVLAIFKSSQ